MNTRKILVSLLIISVFVLSVSTVSAATGEIALNAKVIQQLTPGQEYAMVKVSMVNSFSDKITGWSGPQLVSNYAYAWVKTGVVKT